MQTVEAGKIEYERAKVEVVRELEEVIALEERSDGKLALFSSINLRASPFL